MGAVGLGRGRASLEGEGETANPDALPSVQQEPLGGRPPQAGRDSGLASIHLGLVEPSSAAAADIAAFTASSAVSASTIPRSVPARSRSGQLWIEITGRPSFRA
jgi:hypothetical protein